MKKFKNLSEVKKTQFTRIAMGLAGISINDATAELVWRTLKRMDEKMEDFSITDGVELEFFIRKKYKIQYPKWSASKYVNKEAKS